MELLPARATREEAEAECRRMEGYREANNARCDEHDAFIKAGGKAQRGDCFRFIRNNHIYSVKEIT